VTIAACKNFRRDIGLRRTAFNSFRISVPLLLRS
jgi:hypothetical protein